MMMRPSFKLFRSCAVTLSSLLVLGACQSMPSQVPGDFNVEQAMPGDAASARYAYLATAIDELEFALAKRTANLENVVFASDLYEQEGVTTNSDAKIRADALRELAESEFANSGHYELVHADTHNGRIEFRSRRTGRHLSITVRQSDDVGMGANEYVVTDMFSQVSLRKLARENPVANAASQTTTTLTVQLAALRRVAQVESTNDLKLLAYLDGLPALERDREDILRTRAMLAMRQGNDKAAISLVRRGIVRYPSSSVFFVLAEQLLERSGTEKESATTSLKTIMAHRFTGKSIGESRRSVREFMDAQGQT